MNGTHSTRDLGRVAGALAAVVIGGLIIVSVARVISSSHTKARRDLGLTTVPRSELSGPSLNPNAVEIKGVSPRERKLLRTLLLSTPAEKVKSISLENNGIPGKRTIAFSGPNTIRAEWEQEVLGSLFIVRARETKIPGVPVASVFTVGSSGPATLNEVEADAADAGALRKAIRRAVARSGARLLALRLYRPIGVLPTIVVETPDAAKFVKHGLRSIRSLLSNAPGSEGYYLLVVDNYRRRVYEEAYAARDGTGTTFEPVALRGCDPDSPRIRGVKTPPCPSN